MAQTRLTFFNHGDPEHLADPWVADQVQLGRLLLARQEAQRAQQGLAADLEQRRYGQQADARDFQQRQYEFQARLADEAAARREQAMRADRLFEAQRQDANARLGLDREELGVRREGLTEQRQDRLTARQERLSDRQLADERWKTSRGDDLAARQAAEERWKAEVAAREANQREQRAADALNRAEMVGQREADRALDEQRYRDQATRQDRAREDVQAERRALLGEAAATKEAAKSEARDYNRDVGMTDAAARFAAEAQKIKASDDSDEAKLAALVAAVERQIRPPAEAVDVDPTTGRKLPVWRPTSKEELDALQARLLQAALEVFPEFKTRKPLPPTAAERARTDEALGPVGRTLTNFPGVGAMADTLTAWTPEVAWRLLGQPERTEPGLGARAIGTAYGRNAGLFKTRSGR